MKKLLISIAFLFAGGFLFASDLDGIWNFVFYHNGDAHSEVISLKFEGSKVTGKWWNDEISGIIDGDNIRLDFWRGDSRDPIHTEKNKHSVIEGKVYDRKVIIGFMVTTGGTNWDAPVVITRAKVNSAGTTPVLHNWTQAADLKPVKDSELNGTWNVHIHLDAVSQHMHGEIWPLVFHLQVVDGTRVKGFLWDQHVDGTFKNGELILKFPYWNQNFTDEFCLQAKVKDGKLVGTYQNGLLYGRCEGSIADYGLGK